MAAVARSDLAIARTTPVLMGLYSIVTMWTHKLQQQHGIEAKSSAWYTKKHPTGGCRFFGCFGFGETAALASPRIFNGIGRPTPNLKVRLII
jgi:hypothetical protein